MADRAMPSAEVAVTRPGKVLYPAAGFTKADMIGYYRSIGRWMLPHLAHRPVTLVRYPDGVDGASFYEKRCPAEHPPFLRSAAVASARHGTITFPMVENLPSLLWLANRAAIEFHTYLYRIPRQEAPTMMVFDLDPGPPAALRTCIEIALKLRQLLSQLELDVFAKTSGGKGLHLVVPVQHATFAQTKCCARDLAEALVRHDPRRVTAVMARDQRAGKVFIDWSQNDHGKTTACAYTLRARSTPTVSAPVGWKELEGALAPRSTGALAFSPDDVIARVASQGDLHAPVLSVRQRLPRRWAQARSGAPAMSGR
jgi:bifunctional non-homologous end joining protein LigD